MRSISLTHAAKTLYYHHVDLLLDTISYGVLPPELENDFNRILRALEEDKKIPSFIRGRDVAVNQFKFLCEQLGAQEKEITELVSMFFESQTK